MSTEFKFPDVGEGITEGEIVKWRVKEGDQVKEHDIIAEIETDKAIVEIPAPQAGTILKIYHKEGDTVKVGETLVLIGEKGEEVKEPAFVAVHKPEEKKAFTGVVGYIEEAQEEAEGFVCKVCGARLKTQEALNEHMKIHQAPIETGVLATPVVRRLSKDLQVDISKIKGTGLGGRITEEDVRKYAQQTQGLAEPPLTVKVTRKYDMWGYVERVPLKGVRKVTAEHMSESVHTAAHVTHMEEADVTQLWEIREREKEKAKTQGIHLTFIPFIMKALIHAFREHPYLNAELDDEHAEIILKKYYNIGVAVDVEDGLLVPVIKGADQKSMLQIAKELQDLSDKARNRTIDLADMKGGTFTITNYGSIGGIHGTPIINYPEAAILGVGRIMEKPVIKDGKIVIRKILPLSLSFDHKVLDGAEAARFVNTLMEYLEDPGKLLIEED